MRNLNTALDATSKKIPDLQSAIAALERLEFTPGFSTDLRLKEAIDICRRFFLGNKFANGEIDVLLSSEVGSEGLDQQHCHRLVNYDLPWNPMKIEQRIGRLDRFGQQAERDYLNMAVEGRPRLALALALAFREEPQRAVDLGLPHDGLVAVGLLQARLALRLVGVVERADLDLCFPSCAATSLSESCLRRHAARLLRPRATIGCSSPCTFLCISSACL